jgi:hypothetical protein
MQIVKNFLDKDIFKKIQDTLSGNEFPWHYSDSVAYEKDTSDFMFFHVLYLDNNQRSPYFHNILMPILGKLNFNYLLRAKVNFYTQKEKHIKTFFHTDSKEKHSVALFSINSNNGYTLFKNGDKVPSVENQLVIFDGNLEHCSVAQTDKKLRININININ